MKPLSLSGIPNRRDLLREAERLGCLVETVERKGEVRVTGPYGTRVNLNNRRKDGTRALITMLRALQAGRRPRAATAREVRGHRGKGLDNLPAGE